MSLLVGHASEFEINMPEATDVEAYLRQGQKLEPSKMTHIPKKRNAAKIQ